MKLHGTPGFISTHKAALRLVFIYAGFSLLWVSLFDQTVLYFVKDADILTGIQMLKGWVFVIASALILYILLLQEITKVERNDLNSGEHPYSRQKTLAFVKKPAEQAHQLVEHKSGKKR